MHRGIYDITLIRKIIKFTYIQNSIFRAETPVTGSELFFNPTFISNRFYPRFSHMSVLQASLEINFLWVEPVFFQDQRPLSEIPSFSCPGTSLNHNISFRVFFEV